MIVEFYITMLACERGINRPSKNANPILADRFEEKTILGIYSD